MLPNKETIESFWSQRKYSGMKNPCHFENDWMNLYAWNTRTSALKKIVDIFRGAKKITDVGCGTGEYTRFLTYLTGSDTSIIGFDRDEFASLAKVRNIDIPANRLKFDIALYPNMDLFVSMVSSDIVTLFTVLDFMSPEDQTGFIKDLEHVKIGSRVVIIDLFMDKVPKHQQDLSYKFVPTRERKIWKFFSVGFDLEHEIVVNRMDNVLFHLFGGNKFSYYLSKFLDTFPIFKPRMKLLVFRKIS